MLTTYTLTVTPLSLLVWYHSSRDSGRGVQFGGL